MCFLILLPAKSCLVRRICYVSIWKLYLIEGSGSTRPHGRVRIETIRPFPLTICGTGSTRPHGRVRIETLKVCPFFKLTLSSTRPHGRVRIETLIPSTLTLIMRE